MKTIFVFNNSRVTDTQQHIVTISDDGHNLGLVKFTDWTLPYLRYAMCLDESCDASGTTLAIVRDTREQIQAICDARFGAGQWLPVWIESPKLDRGCAEALRLLQEHAAAEAERVTTALSDVIAMLATVPGVQPQTQH